MALIQKYDSSAVFPGQEIPKISCEGDPTWESTTGNIHINKCVEFVINEPSCDGFDVVQWIYSAGGNGACSCYLSCTETDNLESIIIKNPCGSGTVASGDKCISTPGVDPNDAAALLAAYQNTGACTS